MSLSRDQVLQLMAYADGELDESERAAVEALLAESDEAKCVAAAMAGSALGAVSGWLDESLEERATAAGADGIADAVIGALASERRQDVAAKPAPPIIDIASARARAPRQRNTGVVIAGVLALAAGVAFYVATQKPSGVGVPVANVLPTHEVPAHEAKLPSPIESALPAATAVAASGPPSVDIDSEANDVSVFYVPPSPAAAVANVNAAAVVIWVGDDPPPTGTPR